MKHLYSLILLLILTATGCINNEGDISINAAVNDSKEATPTQGDNPEETSPEETPPEETPPEETSLIFSEDFETGSLDSSKWHLYKSSSSISTQIENHNSSKAWSANYGSSTKWDASITTKQNFTLPITIEWDLDMESNYSAGSAEEGICIYEDSYTTNFSRDSWKRIQSATNLGCIQVHRRININGVPALKMRGIFYDSSDPRLTNFYGTMIYKFPVPNLNAYRDFRVTVNIDTDLSYDVTIQFKDQTVSSILYDGVVSSNTQNFYIQFNNVDYGNYKSFYDNINIWNGIVSPTPIE